MTSFIEMSLDDIIQKKKKQNPRSKNIPRPGHKKQIPLKNISIMDARNKIIFNKRTRIVDARDKLAELAKQKDARLKLDQLRRKREPLVHQRKNKFPIQGKFLRTIPNKDRVFMDSSRQVVSQPLSNQRMPIRQQMNTRKFMEDRSIENRGISLGKIVLPKPIVRTVENDLEIIDDPMGEEEYVPQKKNTLDRKASLQLKIIAHNNDSWNKRSAVVQRAQIPQRDMSPPRPPSILKKRPMASLRDKKDEKVPKPVLEHRIIVSNLSNTVTGGDIEELFGDVGGMLESRLVRPGTAEVIYKSVEDAQKAVDLYHNRQLDGQPMNCLLVIPRSDSVSSSGNAKPALYSTNSNVEPDISTFHKVLFSNF